MKYLRNISLVFYLIFSIGQSYTWQPSPDTTFLAFDIDDVLVQPAHYQKINFVASGMWHNPWNSHNWLKSLMGIKNSYKKDREGKKENLYDEYGNPINGITFHFLYHGIRDTNLTQYASWAVNFLEHSRNPIDGTIKICQYVKAKGYTIVFATNKDRVSYDAFAEKIGDQVTLLPKKVFVSHPGNCNALLERIKIFAEQSDIPLSYKQLADKALTIEPTTHIHHVPNKKPDPLYYECVHNTVKKEFNKSHMIFIDDKQKNINGIENYAKQNTQPLTIIGITFKNPYLLAQRLVELGLLSEEKDHIFLKKMNKYK